MSTQYRQAPPQQQNMQIRPQDQVAANQAQQQIDGGQQASNMSNNVFSVDTQHEDNINDCQFDYYGTQVASCDSKGFLQISSVRNDGQQHPEVIFEAHEGPIWQVAWAHPKYESVIATCGYDGKVRVWKRDLNNNWNNLVFEENLASSVNCIAWAPWEYGLILAAGTAEGRLVIIQRQPDNTWVRANDFIAHQTGVNGISWGPATEPAILAENSQSAAAAATGGKFQPPPKRLATGGNDNEVQFWELREGEQEPINTSIGRHNDWVRDVAWCPNIGLMSEMIASCSEDGTCKVWVSDPNQPAKGQPLKWNLKQEISLDGNVPLWKVSWSQVGNMLAISGGDNQVRIMSENANGEWKQIQVVNEETSQEQSQAAAGGAGLANVAQ